MKTRNNRIALGLLAIGVTIALTAGSLQSVVAQEPGGEGEYTPPTFDLGQSEEAQAEMKKTAEQDTFVRPETSDDAGTSTTDLITYLTIFILAIFLGFEIITKVPPTLHTPLMSGSNAISGITLVGAILAGGAKDPLLSSVLAFLAVTFATINAVGGFLVTHRMLAMFRKKG